MAKKDEQNSDRMEEIVRGIICLDWEERVRAKTVSKKSSFEERIGTKKMKELLDQLYELDEEEEKGVFEGIKDYLQSWEN